jgi:hypothetical protein
MTGSYMLESARKKRCTRALEEWGWEVIHLIQTNKNGIPDTLALRLGIVVFIEFKQPGKRPDPLQEYRHKKLREHGFTVLIVHDLSDIGHLR